MVNSLLFRWEDSQALQHHCRFCERPLSHPGAKASCFGTHSEPCHRFHQMMFMRNRGHTCNSCRTIDEAHYKRHHDLITQLWSIYECCSETDWKIMAVEPGDLRRGHLSETPAANDKVDDTCFTKEVNPASKRERKDVKSLNRAASRTKIVTQEEVRYIDAVIHSSESAASGSVSPANIEEVQLIEEHLRYNANVYNNHSSHKALRRFAKIPEVDVDFESEVERVFDTFRITELLRRNLKNRRLQGKGLKVFESLVSDFRTAVVEDLVLVKKDTMEIRMRRAGYLRYTNKSAYSIVEHRYTEKNWKTGERITSSTSESSERSSISLKPVLPLCERSEPPVSMHTFPADSDNRHLQHVHTRVNGNDGLDQEVIEPYYAPLLSLAVNAASKRPAVLPLNINVIENKESKFPEGDSNPGWIRRDVARQTPVSLAHGVAKSVLPSRLPPKKAATTQPPSKPIEQAWWKTSDFILKTAPLPGADEDHFPSLPMPTKWSQITTNSTDSLAVQPPERDNTTSLQDPECPIPQTEDTETSHPVVSHKNAKKAKKALRETKRKAKKASHLTEDISILAVKAQAMSQKAVHDIGEGSTSSSIRDYGSPATIVLPPQSSIAAIVEHIDIKKDTRGSTAVGGEATDVEASPKPSITTIPRTSHGRHENWARFLHEFNVDQLTAPLLASLEGCSHTSSCQFEGKEVLDCPFHRSRCPCADPLANQCGILYPGDEFVSLGPYNRSYCQRLIAMYAQHESTKGRVMLVDPDIMTSYFGINSLKIKSVHGSAAPGLLREHIEFEGCNRGPYLRQEAELQRTYLKNLTMEHQLTEKMLQDIQQQNDNWEGSVQLCYCMTSVIPEGPEIIKEFGKGIVVCSYRMCEFGTIFHKRCVTNLGVEKVTQWYCTACEKKMDMWAHKALNLPYKDPVVLNSLTEEEKLMAKKISARVKQPSGEDGLKQCL